MTSLLWIDPVMAGKLGAADRPQVPAVEVVPHVDARLGALLDLHRGCGLAALAERRRPAADVGRPVFPGRRNPAFGHRRLARSGLVARALLVVVSALGDEHDADDQDGQDDEADLGVADRGVVPRLAIVVPAAVVELVIDEDVGRRIRGGSRLGGGPRLVGFVVVGHGLLPLGPVGR
ncbi:hypothetical protein ACE2AJ_12375 [Aquihabitans daechungensis]|uniref:hypothetical protein n=1 Tax=Aquihabitans daechungensis TaxID=1052257 RepID=UPI003B9FDA67